MAAGLRGERKGSTRGTERARDGWGVGDLTVAFCSETNKRTHVGPAGRMDVMLLSSTRRAAENGGVGSKKSQVVGCNFATTDRPTARVRFHWEALALACSLSGRGCNVTPLTSKSLRVLLSTSRSRITQPRRRNVSMFACLPQRIHLGHIFIRSNTSTDTKGLYQASFICDRRRLSSPWAALTFVPTTTSHCQISHTSNGYLESCAKLHLFSLSGSEGGGVGQIELPIIL
jgi:hypothetical protein